MTNGERADRLLSDAQDVVGEVRSALSRQRCNLAARRAQEVIELVIKALLNEMGVEYARTHDPAPLLASTLRARHLDYDPAFLDRLAALSAELAEIRSPAFYQEMAVGETEARGYAEGAERALEFGRNRLARLRDA